MSNGQPGVSQTYGGTGYAASLPEIYQRAGLEGQFGMMPIGSDGLVWLGSDYDAPARTETITVPKRGQMQRNVPVQQRLFSVSDAELEYFRFDNEQVNRWEELTTKFVGYTPNPNYQQSLWRDAVTYVANYQKATGQAMSPWQYMEAVSERQAAGRTANGAYTGPVTTVSRSRDINLTNPSEARAFLDNALGEYLGRLPTDEEYKNFTRALNIQERGAPVITEQTTTVTPQGDALRTQESEGMRRGGFTPGQFATEFARSQEGAAETAVGGPLLSAFLNLLRGNR